MYSDLSRSECLTPVLSDSRPDGEGGYQLRQIEPGDAPALTVSDHRSAQVKPSSSGTEIDSAMRIALVHDWFPAMRGGERVASSLLNLFPDRLRPRPVAKMPNDFRSYASTVNLPMHGARRLN